MEKRRPALTAHTIVVELSHVPGTGTVSAVLSIPGRDGTVTREWSGRAGVGPTEQALEDVRAWVALTVDNWLLLECPPQLQF